MAIIVNIALILGLTLALALPVRAASNPTELSLEQLLETTVTTASKYEQKQSEVAGVVSVITRDEIKAFGWRTLDQALASLPGIHLSYDRLYSKIGARGFGLPGDYNAGCCSPSTVIASTIRCMTARQSDAIFRWIWTWSSFTSPSAASSAS